MTRGSAAMAAVFGGALAYLGACWIGRWLDAPPCESPTDPDLRELGEDRHQDSITRRFGA